MRRVVILVLAFFTFFLSSCLDVHTPKTKIIRYGPENGIDTFIQNSLRYHDWVWGQLPVLISMSWTDDVNGSILNDARILMDFPELSQMNSHHIDSAKLTLYKVKNYPYILGGQYGNNANNVYCIKQEWNQNTVNWDNQPAIDSTFSITVPQNNKYDSVVINLTELLPRLIRYGCGVMIMQEHQMPWSSSVYCSSNDSIPENRPKLTIYYR